MEPESHKNRVKAMAAAVFIVGLTAGCGGIPKETQPEVASSYVPVPTPVEVPSPIEGRESDLLLRDFFTASAYPAENYSAARAFLTADAAGDWNPTGSVEVLQNPNLFTERSSENEVEYRVTGDIVGSLTPDGIFEPKFESYNGTYRLVRGSVTEDWRVDGLPASVIIDRSGLVSAFRPRELYFVDATRERLVSDRRWMSTEEESQVENLLNALIAGPKTGLVPSGQKNMLDGATVHARRDSGAALDMHRDSNALIIDFDGVDQLSQLNREELAAEVVWTLAKAEVRGPFVIYANGELLLGEDSAMLSHQDQSLLRWDPDTEVRQPFRALNEGALYDANPDLSPPQLIDQHLSGDSSILFAAAAPTGNHVATVSRRMSTPGTSGSDSSGVSLSIGEIGKKPKQVVTGDTMSRPTWGTVDAERAMLYAVIDGEKLLKVNYDVESGELISADTQEIGELSRLPSVAQGTLSEPKISVFRVSPDGAHVLALIEGELYVMPMAALLDSDSRSVFTHIGHQFDDTAVSATWKDNSTILVGTSSQEYPLWQITVDGSEATVLPSSGLEAPVVDVAALGNIIYATDSRAMMQLNQADSDNRFWREVAAFQGRRAVPIFGH